ncbi:hypothetical protein VTK26DRAFT_6690 [Humicola hyalothermophila]
MSTSGPCHSHSRHSHSSTPWTCCWNTTTPCLNSNNTRTGPCSWLRSPIHTATVHTHCLPGRGTRRATSTPSRLLGVSAHNARSPHTRTARWPKTTWVIMREAAAALLPSAGWTNPRSTPATRHGTTQQSHPLSRRLRPSPQLDREPTKTTTTSSPPLPSSPPTPNPPPTPR